MLLGTDLRVAEGVADGEGHAVDGHLDVRVADEVLAAILALDVQLAATVETEKSADAQVQLVLQQRLRSTGCQQVETAAPALQGVVLRRGDGEGTELQVPGQSLLHADHCRSRPSAVLLVEGLAAQVRVVQTAIEEEACVFGHQVVHVAVQSRLVTLHDIAVGRVQQVLRVVEAVLRDGVVHEVVVQVQVHHQFRCEEVVDERQVMVLLHVELGVTIAEGDGVGLVHVGVQDKKPIGIYFLRSDEVLGTTIYVSGSFVSLKR